MLSFHLLLGIPWGIPHTGLPTDILECVNFMDYGIRRLNIAFTNISINRHWAESIQFLKLTPDSLRSNPISSSNLPWAFLQVPFMPNEILRKIPIFSHSDYMPCLSQPSRFNHCDYIRLTAQTNQLSQFLIFIFRRCHSLSPNLGVRFSRVSILLMYKSSLRFPTFPKQFHRQTTPVKPNIPCSINY